MAQPSPYTPGELARRITLPGFVQYIRELETDPHDRIPKRTKQQ